MSRRSLLAAIPAAALALVLAWEINAPDDGADQMADKPALEVEQPGAPQPATVPSHDHYAKAVTTILARPLFSPSRRTAEPLVAAPAAETTGIMPRLSGIVVGVAERHAIFVDAAGHSRTVTEGMTIDSYTVQAIEPGQVVLTSPKGSHVLHPSFTKTANPEPARKTAALQLLSVETGQRR